MLVASSDLERRQGIAMEQSATFRHRNPGPNSGTIHWSRPLKLFPPKKAIQRAGRLFTGPVVREQSGLSRGLSERKKVSDAVLTPAVSQLSKHSLIVTYDVSDLLKEGANDLVLWTDAGWYRKHFSAAYDGALVCAEFDLDGQTVLTTDASWLGRESGYRDLGTWIHDDYTGECINAQLVPEALNRAALDTLQWTSVDTVSVSVKAVQQMCEPCRIQETFSAVSVRPYGENMWIADMGRVVNGLPTPTQQVAAPTGARSSFRHLGERI